MINLFKRTHYLHVSFTRTVKGNIDYTNYALVKMEGKSDLPWLKEELRKIMCKELGFEVSETPIIISMTEISKSLWKQLYGLQ